MGGFIRHRVTRFTGDRLVSIAGVLSTIVIIAVVSLVAASNGTDWGLTLGPSDNVIIVKQVVGVNLAWNFGIRPGQRVLEIDGRDPRAYTGRDLGQVKRIVVADSSGRQRIAQAPNLPAAVLGAQLVGALFFVGLGAVVYRWAVDARVGLTFLVFGWAVAAALASIPAGNLGYPLGVLLAGTSAVVASSSFFVLFLIFPRPLHATPVAATSVGAATLALICTIIIFVLSGTAFPPVLDGILWLWVAFGFVGGLILLGLRARDPEDRERLAPIVVGTIVGVAPLLLLNALPDVVGHVLILPPGLAALGLVGIPIGFTYAILRHRLFALDALMRRLLLRFADVATFVVVFDLAWAPLRRLGMDDLSAAVVAVIIVALVVPFVSARLHDLIDKSLYTPVFRARSRSSFGEHQAVRDLGVALTSQVRQLVPVQWVALVGHGAALGTTSADDDAPPVILIAVDGDAPVQRLRGRWVDDQPIWLDRGWEGTVVPIVSGNRALSALAVGPRLNDAPLNGLDVETIRLLAQQAAASLEAALLREQAEEERRFRDGLSSFARGLATAGSVEQVLQVTVCQSRQLLGSDVGLIWLKDPSGEFSLAATDGDDAEFFAATWETIACGEGGTVTRERYVAFHPDETFSRITYRLGEVDAATAVGVVIRKGADNPFSQEDERRAGEIVEHAGGAFYRAFAIARAAEAETLRQITKVRSEFLDIVSHDLQNPLTVIRGFAELLEMRLSEANDTYVSKSLVSIVEATATCQHLIEDLLTSSRIERGQLALNREMVDVEKFLTRLVNNYQVVPDGCRVQLAAIGAVKLSADAARLEQMVGNLVTNALRYSEAGPITVGARRISAHEACIEVCDQGKGIPPEDQPRIWDRFYRAKSGQLRTTRGAGVGLSVVRTLAELHGGRAEVESTPGHGTTFRIVLPLNDHPASEPPAAHDSPGTDSIAAA